MSSKLYVNAVEGTMKMYENFLSL